MSIKINIRYNGETQTRNILLHTTLLLLYILGIIERFASVNFKYNTFIFSEVFPRSVITSSTTAGCSSTGGHSCIKIIMMCSERPRRTGGARPGDIFSFAGYLVMCSSCAQYDLRVIHFQTLCFHMFCVRLRCQSSSCAPSHQLHTWLTAHTLHVMSDTNMLCLSCSPTSRISRIVKHDR